MTERNTQMTFVAIVLAFLAFCIFVVVKYARPVADKFAPEQVTQVTETDWKKGALNGKVTLMEYSDFQCPACMNMSSTIDELIAAYPNDLTVVYRHLPLSDIHANAEIGARAAEAAGLQGKFWEMHDVLFEKQSSWSVLPAPKNTLIGYAKELGLDEKKFISDFEAKESLKAVIDDTALAHLAGLRSTPSIFINGELTSPGSFEEMSAIIEQKIAAE